MILSQIEMCFESNAKIIKTSIIRCVALFLLVISCYGSISAQEVSYLVGQPANPDPLMRHHEVFMDAFVKYINRPKKLVGDIIVDRIDGVTKIGNKSLTQDSNSETCRIETVSGVTHEWRGLQSP